MNILYVLNSGQPGGMETHVLDLVKASVADGNNIYVWCNDGPIVDWYEKAGAKVSKKKILLNGDPLYILGLVLFLISNKIDVIHAHEVKAVMNSLVAGALAFTKVRVSHTHTPISEWKIPESMKKINLAFYTRFVNWFATTEVALTISRKKVKVAEGIKEKKIVVIPNCIEDKFTMDSETHEKYRYEMFSRFSYKQSDFIIGNLSRLTEEKGHDVLIDGFKKFVDTMGDRVSNVKLLIAGGGKLELPIQQKIDNYKLQDRVIITGAFPEEDLLKLYSTFDMFVFPSLAEGFGIVLIEAMSLGLPILCSDLEVLKEVGGSGVNYFKAGDSTELASHLTLMFGDMDTQKLRSAENKFRVKKLYSFDNFKKCYLNLYSFLLKETK